MKDLNIIRETIQNDIKQAFETINAAPNFSTDEEKSCLYRGPNNTKCVVGHLIPDELYHNKIEYMGAQSTEVKKLYLSKYPNVNSTEETFIYRAQTYHDTIAQQSINPQDLKYDEFIEHWKAN